jgi:hypothetical protein
MCSYDENIKDNDVSLKPGDIVRVSGTGSYTVLEDRKIYSHTLDKVMLAVSATSLERHLAKGTAELVYPKPEPKKEFGPGAVVEFSPVSGPKDVYTITADDSFFCHKDGKIYYQDSSAIEHCKKNSRYFKIVS